MTLPCLKFGRIIFALKMILWCAACSFAATENITHQFVGLGKGAYPAGRLISDSAGNLYGSLTGGGLYGQGVVFRLTLGANGKWTEKVLHNFQGGTDGSRPAGTLAMDAAGNLYGATELDGSANMGTIFSLTPDVGDQWTETILHNFTGSAFGDGAFPEAGLTIDGAGNLYGTSVSGGSSCGCGTVFELARSSSGWGETILHSFAGSQQDGVSPRSDLVFDGQGNLYGSSNASGSYGPAVFKLTPAASGWSFSVIYSFGTTDNVNSLALDAAGNIFGASGGSSSYPDGRIFELSPGSNGGWSEQDLFIFTNVASGKYPSGVVLDKSGNIYGVTNSGGTATCQTFGCGLIFRLNPGSGGSWTESLIHIFQANGDGNIPLAAPVIDGSGRIWGNTSGGGLKGVNAGVVYELTPQAAGSWSESVYAFPATDISLPAAALVTDGQGHFYGTTLTSGPTPCPNSQCGAVFELTQAANGSWAEKILHSFTDTKGDGSTPDASLILDSAGNLYGTTLGGGNANSIYGTGTVFELSPQSNGTWTERILYSFGAYAGDGTNPGAALAFDGAGNLYGTTASGGIGFGTVFKLTPTQSGPWQESVIYAFHGKADGGTPYASVVLDAAGNLYGTTIGGGAFGGICNPGGCGVAYKLSLGSQGVWTETPIYTFKGRADGAYPSGLTIDQSGNLYGTTQTGNQGLCGASNCGLVFELTPGSGGTWTENVLYGFKGDIFGKLPDGAEPEGGVVLDGHGNLFGTTSSGGLMGAFCYLDESGCGTVFELSPVSGGTWNENILYEFTANPLDGFNPGVGVILDPNGNLYGTSKFGGTAGAGVAFQIVP